jgi:hypothetical protein
MKESMNDLEGLPAPARAEFPLALILAAAPLKASRPPAGRLRSASGGKFVLGQIPEHTSRAAVAAWRGPLN